jgi:hypothetical protein
MTIRLAIIAATLALATGAASAAPTDATPATRHGPVAKHGVVAKHFVGKHFVGKRVVGKRVVIKNVVAKHVFAKPILAKRVIVARPGMVAVARPAHIRLAAYLRHERALWLARHRHHHILVEKTGIKTVEHVETSKTTGLAGWIARHAEHRAERRMERHAMNQKGAATTPARVIR